jgi:3-hydroxy-9,10-secoandrosta-1,3,5(10)-triene-9,17-dione monooxygenase reductase component
VTVTVEPATLREVLGHFASGVVVVTAAGPDGPLGFTCQSFASLSLDPVLIRFSPSRTPLLFHRGRYGLADPSEEER